MKRGRNRGVPVYIEPCEVRCCCTAAAAAAAAVPLLYCVDTVGIRRKCGLEFSLVASRIARKRTHKRAVSRCHKKKTVTYCYCCTRTCHYDKRIRHDVGTGHQQRTSSNKKEKQQRPFAPAYRRETVCSVPANIYRWSIQQ